MPTAVRLRSRSIAILLALAAFAVPPAAAEDLGFKVGIWGGKVSFTDDGMFRHCMVARDFPNGKTLFFAIDRRGVFSVALHGGDFEFQKDREYTATVSIDERWAAEVRGVALDPKLLLMPLPNTDELRGHIEQGRVLRFHSKNGATMDFPLKDTSVALPRLIECFQDHGQKNGAGGGASGSGNGNGSGN